MPDSMIDKASSSFAKRAALSYVNQKESVPSLTCTTVSHQYLLTAPHPRCFSVDNFGGGASP